MKNYIFYLLKSKVTLKISGNNIERFIKRLKNNNIEILDIKYNSKEEIIIKIYEKDYEALLKIKTVYNIEICDYYGIIKIKNIIFNNKFVIISIFLALIFLFIITNLIFEIDIVTNDSKMEKILLEELEDLGIKKYNFKKEYTELQVIKQKILSKYKDEIDWIEIESIGTKYIIRYEPRIKNDVIEEKNFRHIVAKKDAIISDMKIFSGQIVKGINSYVKKGEVIVSGYIDLNGNIKDTVSSNGEVYGETWYNVTITYPYKYYESFETGNKKTLLVIKFLSKDIELFNFNKFETKNTKDYILLKNNILPISIVKQIQKETKVINENNDKQQVIDKALKYSMKKLEDRLGSKGYVKNYKILTKTEHSDSITLNIFFTVIEDITEYQNIEEYNQTPLEKEN